MPMQHKTRHIGPIININCSATNDVQTRIISGVGARHKLSDALAQMHAGSRVLVLCQPFAETHWLQELIGSLPAEKYQITTLTVPDGESCKTSEWLLNTWAHLQAERFDRQDTIVALGGGSLTDLAGFAASTYLRGINLILIPTTLLAQVDAAIGGKTGINLAHGKNLAGSIYFPHSVIVDADFLKSLPRRQLLSGLGEICKYALIEASVAEHTEYTLGPRTLLQVLDEFVTSEPNGEDPLLAGIISTCIKIKLSVVAKDPHEHGLRRCLNLGHTLAHALEKVTAYKLSHGEAVAIGLMADTALSVMQNRIDKQHLDSLEHLLCKTGLPTKIPLGCSGDELLAAMFYDKKRAGDDFKMALPQDRPGLLAMDVPVSIAELSAAIASEHLSTTGQQ